MQDDKQEKDAKTLSYEILLNKIEEQSKIIAKQQEQIDDMREVIKTSMVSNSKANENEDTKITNKQEFEKRLKEDLKLC